ncbi:MAG: SDR family oxidoreductase [Pelolinea sp.]|nr:SDR family oxidoreductase [Pelolinea sp.]
MRILVTGASGLLGLNFCLAKMPDHEIFGVTNQTRLHNPPFPVINFDLTKDKTVMNVLDQTMPELVVNCAAMANVDQCEKTPLLAAKINAEMPGRIARECAQRSIQLIHISTDAVFDGVDGNYRESDPPNPLSVYSKTKLAGEQNVLDENSQAMVARVNFFGFSVSGDRSLAEFFLNNLMSGKKVSGFTDILFSPMYVNDLVDILVEMALKKLSGIYNIVSRDNLSKYDFGIMISEKFNLDGKMISPASCLQSELLAKRSPNLVLDISKLLSTGIEVPNVDLAVDHFYNDYKAGLSDLIRSFNKTE